MRIVDVNAISYKMAPFNWLMFVSELKLLSMKETGDLYWWLLMAHEAIYIYILALIYISWDNEHLIIYWLSNLVLKSSYC